MRRLLAFDVLTMVLIRLKMDTSPVDWYYECMIFGAKDSLSRWHMGITASVSYKMDKPKSGQIANHSISL